MKGRLIHIVRSERDAKKKKEIRRGETLRIVKSSTG
jgi:hypothetical protein